MELRYATQKMARPIGERLHFLWQLSEHVLGMLTETAQLKYDVTERVIGHAFQLIRNAFLNPHSNNVNGFHPTLYEWHGLPFSQMKQRYM